MSLLPITTFGPEGALHRLFTRIDPATLGPSAAMVYSNGSSIFGLPKPDVDRFFWFGGGFLGPFPVPVLIAALLVAVAHLILRRTRIGRHIYAIGGNEQVAVMSGIDVGGVKIF